ncbi:Dipeptide ABC transporter, permease protein DppB (TC 3.A.1.5.2) [Olavius algarvensis associated proteobacterium Delta 3]|nr:Dipeptide ABC transporter, permease protein DppB (TC 3.A.1.5.2) [Olavius algarvensis associated proteobacterium Delta 3]CAB5103173.1 Dipeptide ABC transporter, permease protein DppB (TC 3.A.1.5.2) [Olavius algarvensis associated proteobacterium Delta 3]
MELRKYIFRRLIEIAIIFFVILTVLFLLFRLAPGDPVTRMVDPNMTPEDAEHLIEQLGLDQPIGLQYLYYVKNFVTGNFGVSFHYGQPVADIILNRLPNTVLLFTTSIILSALFGIFLGKIAAWRKGESTDTWMTIGALICHTVFLPWLALILIWLFAYKVGWFPLTGMISAEVWIDPEAGFLEKAWDIVHHMILPLGTLFMIHFGSYLLIMRSSMLDTLKEDYILTARAKGLEEKTIRNHHAAPNAALPVVTSVGLSLAFSINGGALTETVFTWPGIGRELVFSVSNNDYPLAQASFLLIAAVVLLANLVVDVLYAYLDPRIRYE